MIDFKPKAGLCNRMQAMESAIALAHDRQMRLHIHWVRDHALHCHFHKLWEPINDPFVRITEHKNRPLKFFLTHTRFHFLRLYRLPGLLIFPTSARDALQAFDFTTVKPTTHIIIESFLRFYPMPTTFPHLQPIRSLQERISERSAPFDPYTIGVHVRRTDNKISILHSPDELFIQQMQKEIATEPRTRFYLATDDMGVKQNFKNIFGERIITTPYEASRTSEEGVQEALVELYALSKTAKILGSYWSSFSRIAGELGGIGVLRVKKDESEHVRSVSK